MQSANPARLAITDQQAAILTAVIDCIVPPDDFPGAAELGVMGYLARILTEERSDDRLPIIEWLRQLEHYSNLRNGSSFVALDAIAQDALLREIDGAAAAPWPAARPLFRLLVDLAMEGYYADPSNGGNAGTASWKMIGYFP